MIRIALLITLSFALGCHKPAVVTSEINDGEMNALIIGADDRTEVVETSSLSRTVGQITTQFAQTPGTQGACTATLIGKNHLITAAHCVFDPARGGLPESVLFSADAYRTKKATQALYFVEKVYLLSEHMELRNKDAGFKDFMVAMDLAILKLAELPEQKAAGEEYGFLPLAQSQAAHDVTVISYPGDKSEGSKWIQNNCTLSPLQKFLSVDCDLIVGASGGAIIAEAHTQPQIRAVVSGESISHNVAATLSEPILNAIQKILQDQEQDLFSAHEMFSQPYHRLFVHNDCKDVLFLGLRWQNLEAEDQVDGFIILQPGQVLRAAKMTSDEFFIYAKKPDHSFELKGTVPMDIAGTSVAAIPHRVQGGWQNVHYKVNCRSKESTN